VRALQFTPRHGHAHFWDLLEEAGFFARSGDFTGAVERAKTALAETEDDDARAEAHLVIARFEAAEREFRRAAERRFHDYERNERAEPGVPA
jgi:hypothetical protein